MLRRGGGGVQVRWTRTSKGGAGDKNWKFRANTLFELPLLGLSPYISLVFPKIFIARGWYLIPYTPYLISRDSKEKCQFPLRIEMTVLAKCLKVKAKLWLLHPIHALNVVLVHFSHQNWRLWFSYRQNELAEDLFCF